jgi:hypothetical protein
MPPAPGPNDLTRQQLDELDVLLNRMLGLPAEPPPPMPTPVPPPAPPLPELPPGWRMDGGTLRRPDPHVATLTPAFVSLAAVGEAAPHRPPVIEAIGQDDDDREPEPVIRFGPPTAATGPFVGTLRGADAPALPADFRPAVFLDDPEPEPARVPELKRVPAAEPTPGRRVPVGLWPLFACNWVLETLCGLGGPVGALATRPAGKHVLGVAGVVLLAGSAAWTARGFGLVDFPVPARPAWASWPG